MEEKDTRESLLPADLITDLWLVFEAADTHLQSCNVATGNPLKVAY